MASIWVIAEHKEGKIKKVSLELLSKGKELGGDIAAVLLGKGVDGLAAQLGKYGAKKVYLAQDDKLEKYTADAYAKVIADLAKANNPDIILLGASVQGKDYSPRLAAKLGAGLATDCTGLDLDGDKLVATRPIYAGKAFVKVAFKASPAIASVRPNVMALGADDGGAPEVV
ncbi:MAG: electron transfer flavoprotein subunit alpha/FixB family protein, partial [bacterium]